jgi:hemerythrin
MNEAEKIHWSKGLSIGNYKIDRDHRKLLNIYNDLVKISNTKLQRDEFAKVLSGMTDYALLHFKKEELYMHELSYPQIDEHITYHIEYLNIVTGFNIEFNSINPPDQLKILKFIENWWINHIMKIDIEYEKYKSGANITAEYNPF